MLEFLLISIAIVVVAVGALVGLVFPRARRNREIAPPTVPPLDERGGSSGGATAVGTRPPLLQPPGVPDVQPSVEADALVPPVSTAPQLDVPELDVPEPTAGRMQRLRARLARSQTSLGRGLLSVLARDRLDEDAWEEIEEALLTADVGIRPTTEIVERLRNRTQVLGTRDPAQLRSLLAEELVTALQPELDRTLRTIPSTDQPSVVLVVGVNGTGKTTTCGKLARVLVADGRTVLLGAADTFRAAAADQLQTWGARVGADTIRGPEGGDPASVAFDAVRVGRERGVDTVLIDTAGRLHTKVGLMDELGKLKRVIEKHGPIDETLLVLDATTGQNGLTQARVFTEVADVTGVVLTKLDGTAKGGIVISVQRELGVPVKLIGLGEGADDLAPFDPVEFVDALLG
ncbi:signal recognition particle-docking protein FtsY [Jatrophihabitans lederbergiae]|uniref:Signal recognition particle receptor FtsY n=1 Tax=Jatrophihabitans lederbergiae TaxID=3075547 RepID=A0ABU2J4L5_9ACTN|nr:signal recognition particle-docking protein FtsY [Jatrophihabitans sp. DSM 44399]MDT0259920.1 signal recognition particle-docking protein FtsY [Jatrophihabitans sp. DSM 44399]